MTGKFLTSQERHELGVPHGDIAVWYSPKTEKSVGLEAKMQGLAEWIRYRINKILSYTIFTIVISIKKP